MSPWLQAGLAGGVAAALWGLVEPFDQKLFRFPYSDIAILGRFVTRGPHWRAAGWAIHVFNGVARRPRLLGALRAVRQQRLLVRSRLRAGRARRHVPAHPPHRPLPPGQGRPRAAADVAVGSCLCPGDVPAPAVRRRARPARLDPGRLAPQHGAPRTGEESRLDEQRHRLGLGDRPTVEALDREPLCMPPRTQPASAANAGRSQVSSGSRSGTSVRPPRST